ncbi:MAG: acylneuraminate cytidylyltransferase family protein [Bacteroidota bacterium]|jgi:N-acylneuraminate cytidylyltransferase/CMP-N,N'-diacetyllegionaminic acid synthase|nr:acylneuraminate cytidylyltransferase family protein [Bacteroidota bacterium]
MIAIIPARGGSKGLPGKNIKNLCGKPLIAYTIEAALTSKVVTRLIVSTDDITIADISQKYGAEVPFIRPNHLATDTAKSIDVYKYTLERLEKEGLLKIEEFMVLQPTSPLRTAKHIDEAFELYKQKDADSVVSYCQEHHPIVWHKYIDDTGKLQPIFEDNLRNRQEEKPTYFPNGAIYIFKRALINQGTFYSENAYAYIMDRNASVDIDTLEDWKIVEIILKDTKNHI